MRTMIFADWSVPRGKTLERFASCGVSDVILGISNSNHRYKLNYTEQKWLEAARITRELGMSPHYMVWSIPRPEDMLAGLEGMQRLSDKQPAAAHWQNAEATFHNGKPALVDQTIETVQQYRQSHEKHPALAVVGFDKLNPKVAKLASVCDIHCPEAYSFWNPETGHWSQSTWTFPGVQQRRAFNAWAPVAVGKVLVFGMACYFEARPASGKFPGCTADQSRRWAINEVWTIQEEAKVKGEIEVDGVAYWSGKFIDGDSPQEIERRSFMRKVAKL